MSVLSYTHQVDIARQEICHHCQGSGARSSEHVHTCEACGGHGVRVVRQMLAPGMYTEMQTT
jgi:DnaJ-related protein SCJ1